MSLSKDNMQQLHNLLKEALQEEWDTNVPFYHRVPLTAGCGSTASWALAYLALYKTVNERWSFVLFNSGYSALTIADIIRDIWSLEILPNDIKRQHAAIWRSPSDPTSDPTREVISMALGQLEKVDKSSALPVAVVVYLPVDGILGKACIQFWYLSAAPGEWLLYLFKEQAWAQYGQTE